jgi:hypothetical protein
VRPDQERELLELVRAIYTNTNEEIAMVREIKLWRKFVAWAFGIATTCSGLWELWTRLRS